MTTWKIGDTWITFNQQQTGIGSGKMQSKQEAHDRRQQRHCTGCGETRQSGCGSQDCDLVGVRS